jgi:hypothetical protein
MPDDVGPNYTALVSELLERLQEADQKLETDPHAAVKDALQVLQGFIIEASRTMAPDGVPRIVPGRAIGRFVAALDDRDRGVPDPVLKRRRADKHSRRALPLTTKIARAEIGILMDILMRAGRTFPVASKEVVQHLGKNHKVFGGLSGNRERIVERWRSETSNSDDPDIAKMFHEHLEEATLFLRDRNGGAADLVRIAHMRLRDFRYA